MADRIPWDSYVGMNQGYNQIFDSWQEISDIISPEANKAVNMALRILDEALDDVKKTVVSSKPDNMTPSFTVISSKESDSAGDEESDDEKPNTKEKKSFGGFKIFGGKK